MCNRVTLAFRILATSIPAVFLALSAHAQLPAFPGADGAAQLASGGRGGVVYHVTKLNMALDDPARNDVGTFLYGLNNANFPPGPRTIVFDVAGVFHLGILDRTNWTSGGNAWDATSRQGITSSNLTIAGQTAPGPVIFMGGSLKPSGSNIIIRNITVAAGYGTKGFWEPPPKTPPSSPTVPTSFTMDGFNVSGPTIIIDHVDTFYASDEAISCDERAKDLTVQYCSNAQGQNYNGHAYGHLLQPNSLSKISFIHNLDAHLVSRLPRVGTETTQLSDPNVGSINDFRNQVTYNWFGNGPGYAGSTAESPNQPSVNNFINNFYLAGNGGDSGISGTQSGGNSRLFQGNSLPYTQAYVAGNRKDVNKDGDPNDDVATTAGSSSTPDFNSIVTNGTAWDVNIGITLTPKAAFTNVLKYVGSRWWERNIGWPPTNAAAIGSNEVNERIIYETFTGTGRVEAWADDPYDTNANEGVEWKALWALRPDTNGVAPFNRPAGWDTDQDGIPDYWELEHGLNPTVTNNNADFDNDGYTDLEEYLNEIAAWPAPGDIYFNGTNTDRYAVISNWQVDGVAVTITNLGTITTSSKWQPSKYDTAIVSNSTVVVDAVGQHAGILRLAPDAANNATLNITNGWLEVVNTLEIANAGTGTLNLSGGKLRVGTLTNGGGTASFNFTGGTLAADTVTFNLVNQGGIISPGDSPGQTHVVGDLTQNGASTLAIDINGTNSGQFDKVVVDGTATLDGALVITFTNGYVPPYGAVVTILTCASRGGTFASFDYPTNDVTMEIVYSSTNVQLLVTQSTFNSAPVFTGVSNHTADVGITMLATNTAVDTDLPPQTLTYSLVTGPSAATLDTNTGVFTWRPDVTYSDTTNLITVSVVDDHIPSLGATQSFSVTVNALTPSTISNPVKTGNQLVFTVNGQNGPDYAVQASTNLTDWTSLLITNSPAMPFMWTNMDIGVEPMLFYRIKAGPPLP
jgi:pectate lyase